MLKWFKNLSDANKIAIVIPVALAAIAGLFGLFKWLSPKKDAPAPQQKTIHQEGASHTPAAVDEDKNIIAGGNVTTGIDSEAALNILVKTSSQLGRTEEENIRLRETIKQLEAQLAKPSLQANIPLEQSTPAPSAQAKQLANLITEDDGLYAQALKAIAEGDNEKADSLLDETQQFLDTVQERKDQAQAKIYIARIQNASYAGRPRDALQYCDKLTTLAGNDSPIINEMAVVYYQNAKYKEAEPLIQRALKIDEASFGKDHPTVAIRLNNLAALYLATNRLKEAEPLMQRALKIDEASFGKDHPEVAGDLNNLAALYQATNRLKEAEPLMQRAIEIDEASFGKDHPEVATDLNNLAALYQATNRLKEADPLLQRALKIDEASFGKDHPNVARDLNNLAQLYKATNRLKEAEPLMQRALEIDEASLGKDHPKVAIRLNNLAALYQATNRLKEAEPLLQRVVEILENPGGQPLPNYAAALNNLAALYHATNRLKEAEPLMQRALKIDEDSFGKDHPEVATDLNNLAQLYQATNRLPEAEPLMKRAVEILLQFSRRTGHPHPHLEAAINNYNALLMQMGHSEAEVAARLKRLAPEMFESPANQLKEE